MQSVYCDLQALVLAGNLNNKSFLQGGFGLQGVSGSFGALAVPRSTICISLVHLLFCVIFEQDVVKSALSEQQEASEPAEYACSS